MSTFANRPFQHLHIGVFRLFYFLLFRLFTFTFCDLFKLLHVPFLGGYHMNEHMGRHTHVQTGMSKKGATTCFHSLSLSLLLCGPNLPYM